jgi:hypothetical protein
MQETLEIRKFSSAAIQAAVDRALAALPPERKVAVVAHADTKGASMSVVVRLGSSWSLVGGLTKPYSGKLDAEARVVFSPF